MPARQSCSNSIEFVSPIENNLTFKFKTPVPEVIHQNQSDYSPTHSQMKGEINVINKANFKINYKYLQEDFEDEENTNKRIWFAQLSPLCRKNLKKEWKNELKQRKFNFPFFTWLLFYTSKIGLNIYEKSQINLQTNLYKKWNLKDNQVVTATQPPLLEIRINTIEGDITASLFKQGREAESSINNNGFVWIGKV